MLRCFASDVIVQGALIFLSAYIYVNTLAETRAFTNLSAIVILSGVFGAKNPVYTTGTGCFGGPQHDMRSY